MQQILDNPPIMSALIAFTGVLLTQLIVIVGLILTGKRIRTEFERKEYSKLIDVRLTCYPQAINIAEQLRSRKTSTLDPPNFGKILHELEEWSKGLPQLVMSDETLETFSILRIELQKMVQATASNENDQIKIIRSANSAFRIALRKDIGLLHKVESQQVAK